MGKGARKDLYPYMFKTIIDIIGYLNYLHLTNRKEDSREKNETLQDVLD